MLSYTSEAPMNDAFEANLCSLSGLGLAVKDSGISDRNINVSPGAPHWNGGKQNLWLPSAYQRHQKLEWLA